MLTSALGRQVAQALLTQATLCYVTTIGPESKRYAAFVRSICSDPRLLEAWGTGRAHEQDKGWGALVDSGPGGRK
jgi:hypothetical protein